MRFIYVGNKYKFIHFQCCIIFYDQDSTAFFFLQIMDILKNIKQNGGIIYLQLEILVFQVAISMCTHQQCMRALVGNMSYKYLLLPGLPLILLVMSSDEIEVLSFNDVQFNNLSSYI